MIICNLKSHPSWKGRKSILKGHLTSRSVFAVMPSRGKEGTQDLELTRSPPSLKAKNTLLKGGYFAFHFMYLLFTEETALERLAILPKVMLRMQPMYKPKYSSC